jgi:hypothetical protein
MKRNQNLDTMSYDELKRLQEREALKGQIQWQQKQNDPKSWKKDMRQQMVKNFMTSAAAGAGQELGKQIINAPVRLAGYAGDKTISLAGYSAKTLVSVATDSKKQDAFAKSVKYLNSPGYRQYTREYDIHNKNDQFNSYNRWKRNMGY